MPGIYWRNLNCSGSYWKLIGAWGIRNHTCFPCLSPKQVVGQYSFPFEGIDATHWLLSWGPGLWWRCLYEHVAQGFRKLRYAHRRFFQRFCHCFVTIALDWLEWRKNYCEARYSFKFSLSIEYGPGLTLPQCISPWGGCLATGTWEALACAVRSDGIEGEEDSGKKQIPQSPGSSPSRVQMLPNPRLPVPPSEKWASSFVTLTSSFPSLCPIQCQNKPDRFQNVKSRWKIQAGIEFIYSFYQRMRERGGKKGGEPDCWCAVLFLKVSLIGFPALWRRQITWANQLLSWMISMDIFPGILMAEDVETNCDTEES